MPVTTPEIQRFTRDYLLEIQLAGRVLQVRPPFEVAFSADLSMKPELNRLDLRVANLSPANRADLVRDEGSDDPRIPVRLQVGYNGQLGTVFQGSLDSAYTERQGGDHFTNIVALDGGTDWRSAFVATTVTTKDLVLEALLDRMENTKRGAIGRFRNKLTRAKVVMGFPADVVAAVLESGQSFFILEEKIYILGQNEVPTSYIPVVSARTGLLRPPEGKKNEVTFSTLLNPAIRLGHLVQLDSSVVPWLSGVYRVDSITCSGDYEGQEWEQEVTGTRLKEYTVVG